MTNLLYGLHSRMKLRQSVNLKIDQWKLSKQKNREKRLGKSYNNNKKQSLRYLREYLHFDIYIIRV